MKLIRNVSLVAALITALAICVDGQDQKESSGKRQGNSRLSVKYDKSKDLTTVRIKQFTISRLTQEKALAPNIPLHQMDLEVWFTFSGQQGPKKVSDVSLRFHAVAGNYVFLRAQQVIVALDRQIAGKDRAMGLGVTDYKSEPPKFNSVYEEYMVIQIPTDALSKIAKASMIEIFVGPSGYQLSATQHDAIREMAAYLDAGTSPSLPIGL